jgi:hypothetical protein
MDKSKGFVFRPFRGPCQSRISPIRGILGFIPTSAATEFFSALKNLPRLDILF